jgi:hypothetical protein
MKKIILFTSILSIVAACDKDNFETKPRLKLLSGNDKTVQFNGTLPIVLEYTDKEGDVSDSVFVKKMRLNRRIVPTLRDSFRLKIPNFPNTTKGEITVNLDYTAIISALNPPNIPGTVPARKESDTLNIQISVRDKAGNTSDTITVKNVIVERQ